MSSVKISNVQAIKYIEFDMPLGEGGVQILRGPNGAGKTTAIACINALLGRKVALRVAQGAPHGRIEGLGVTKEIKSRTSTIGDIEVGNLEGRFDFSDLVDPQVKAPAAREKARVRSLVGLTSDGSRPEDFYELFGGEERFNEIVDAEALAGIDDVIELADKVKSQVEVAARGYEDRVDGNTSRWQLSIEESKGVDPKVEPPSIPELATAYAKAKDASAEAVAIHERNAFAIKKNNSAQQLLKAHQAKKPSKALTEIGEQLKKMDATVKALEEKLATAKATRDEIKERFDDAIQWCERETEINNMLEDVVDEEQLPDAEALKATESEALKALEGAEEAKNQHAAAVRAVELGESIKEETAKAKELRSLAKRCNEVVTSKLPESCALQFRDGKLKVFYEHRDEWVEFDELSEGERWEIGLAVAIEAVGAGGVIPAKQEGWQSLDAESKEAVAKQCADAQVWLVTGEVDEGPLRVESYAT